VANPRDKMMQDKKQTSKKQMRHQHLSPDLRALKTYTVETMKDIDRLIEAVMRSADKTLKELSQPDFGAEGLRALWSIKFQPVGCDPLDSEAPLNFIEQLNQTFTYLASARAARTLISLHPDLAPFILNLGTSPGPDIESAKDGGLAAEVFAAVNTSNNRKLSKDVSKAGRTTARFKYVFFMCPGYEEGRQPHLERNEEVQVWSVGGTL
jgi:hypothetical protein